jgi:hypothetical protein
MFEVYSKGFVRDGKVEHFVHFPYRFRGSYYHYVVKPEQDGDLNRSELVMGWLKAGVKTARRKLDLVRLFHRVKFSYNRYMDDHHPDYYLIRNAKQAERVRNRGHRY